MTETNTNDGEENRLDGEYQDVVTEIEALYYEFLADADAESDEYSDDVGMQLLRDAAEICTQHNVPRDTQIDVICEGHRRAYYRHVDERIENLRWQLEAFSSL